MIASLRAPMFSAGLAAVVLAGTPAQAGAAESLADALTQGKVSLSLRYRYEHVDQDSFEKDADASTLRGRLNFRSADWNGFAAFAEFDYIGTIGWNDYNAGAGNTPDRTQYPVVADPTGADLNQAWLQWSDAGGTVLRGGRQRIIFDNARFVGNVGWRQNEQTYDAAYFQHKKGNLDFQLAWVWQVNRIFGKDVPAGTDDSNTWLANLGWTFEGIGKLTGYYLDIDDEDVASFSTRTWGARLAGSRKLDALTLGYAAEYAHQVEAHDNPVDYSADYYRLDLSLGLGKVTPYVGYESLGGDHMRAGASFRTPLATLHAFNGWADQFLTTPNAGLEDVFAGLKGSLGAWNWDLVYHDFSAESGGGGFGTELDASLSRSFARHYSVLFKAAWFDGDRGAPYPDTTKLWLQLTADF